MKRCLIVTGGGDCPGLNAVIRAIVKRASVEKQWEIVGSIEAFNGVLREPTEIVILDEEEVAGIHYRGGTILQTARSVFGLSARGHEESARGLRAIAKAQRKLNADLNRVLEFEREEVNTHA